MARPGAVSRAGYGQSDAIVLPRAPQVLVEEVTLRQVEAIEQGCAGRVRSHILPACEHSPHREQSQLTLQTMIALLREEELTRQSQQ